MICRDSLPPYSPEAERGVLGCCLLDLKKVKVAVNAGVTPRWFYDIRHSEIFQTLTVIAQNGGGDTLVVVARLRERGKLEAAGGTAYIVELQDSVPSAENLEYYLPDLRDRFRRRQIIQAATQLRELAQDRTIDSAVVLSDTETLLEAIHRQADRNALPDIVLMRDLLEEDIPEPRELVSNVLHQGSKLILGGASKSYKTWVLIDLAISVSTGVPWLGFPTTQGKVLYVNLEIQKAFFRRRNRDVIGGKQLIINHQLEAWNLRGFAADYRILLPKIEERIRDQNYALVVLDPTYKLLGDADENNATDISALLNKVESLAVSTGAAMAMAGHFAKGNPSAKETIDRISGSGVFARDPDSLIIFTKHEEEGAFAVEMVLRNFRPIPPFVVRWEYPLFRRAEDLDPTQLKRLAGRPRAHSHETLLKCLGDQRLRTGDWKSLAKEDYGVSESRFYALLNELERDRKVEKSAVDGRWYQIHPVSQNSKRYKDQ